MGEMKDLLPVEVKYPQEIKCPVVLLLDTSYSMHGEPMKLLNEGVGLLFKEISNDHKARKRVELAIITFGGSVKIAHNFSVVEDYQFKPYEADGETPMGHAILEGLELLEERKKQYKSEGIAYYRPWLVLMTDGYPTDMEPKEGDSLWQEVRKMIQQAENEKRVICWAFGVEGADMTALFALFANKRVFKLKGFPFKEIFLWLSSSIGRVIGSKPGEKVVIDVPPSIVVEV